jgi:hypothetical protein
MKNNYSFLFAILLIFFSAFLFTTTVFGGKTSAQSAKRPKPTPTVTPTKVPTPTPTTVNSITDIEVIVRAPQQITSPNLINYFITVINHGPKVATAVQLCSKLDPTYFAINFINEGNFRAMIGGVGRYGDCSVYGELDSLAVGSSETMSYTISEISPIIRINTVDVSAIETDINLINNTQIVTTFVN